MKNYLVTHYKFKSLNIITKQKSVNDAIKHVAGIYGYSVLELSAHDIEDLLEVSYNTYMIKFE